MWEVVATNDGKTTCNSPMPFVCKKNLGELPPPADEDLTGGECNAAAGWRYSFGTNCYYVEVCVFRNIDFEPEMLNYYQCFKASVKAFKPTISTHPVRPASSPCDLSSQTFSCFITHSYKVTTTKSFCQQRAFKPHPSLVAPSNPFQPS